MAGNFSYLNDLKKSNNIYLDEVYNNYKQK
jgi:hypothetical protein